ncbi:hypothetical protein RIF29_05673 [Crotalaria pallida]|uniref:Bifunctional inhibitor/plant lipid transfer protein/seed storage helical domain-containing protein n=1 Tax=Crotalaria pallida TaxID=3830 RepID=A0AAN9PAF4_CROPI
MSSTMAIMPHIFCILILTLSLISVLDMAEATLVLHNNAHSACERIIEYFTYCLGFVVDGPNYGCPLKRCCQHVEKLNILAKHRTGPRLICWCIQVMVKGVTPSLDPSRTQHLPLICNTTLSFPISDSMDCSK